MKLSTICSIALIVFFPSAMVQAEPAEDMESEEPNAGFSRFVDAQGAIRRPTEYRTEWVHLGSWFVRADESARGPGVHDVYAEPAAVESYLKTGRWADGSTLVKEIRSIESGPMTTGMATWGGEVGVWFVMVKDSKGRFPDNEVWGEGWGWALFEAERPDVNVNDNWKQGDLSNCYGCHIPAKKTDWVFIEGYPPLRGDGTKGQ